jgi:hypothetical protein
MPAGGKKTKSGDMQVFMITTLFMACSILEIARLLAGGHPEELTATGTWTRALFLGWILSWFPAVTGTVFIDKLPYGQYFSELNSLKGRPLRKALAAAGIISLPLTGVIICVSAILAQFMG